MNKLTHVVLLLIFCLFTNPILAQNDKEIHWETGQVAGPNNDLTAAKAKLPNGDVVHLIQQDTNILFGWIGRQTGKAGIISQTQQQFTVKLLNDKISVTVEWSGSEKTKPNFYKDFAIYESTIPKQLQKFFPSETTRQIASQSDK